ncbi:hypothetical protein ALQ48_01779 [Pseudomonas coronafaciens pv. zizaniae]|nr:Uncharacterized protein AC511_0756 [Pseudomonas coronafaciens pv. oryzae]RMO05221.1 hypothetical protein ALQ48_01779 [Pseudomonas coronafaciens pv. zizaniae]
MLVFTAIVTYMTRGQVKAGLMGGMDSIAARCQASGRDFKQAVRELAGA